MLIPGDELSEGSPGRLLPRIRPATRISVRYRVHDRGLVEVDVPAVELRIVEIAAILEEIPALGTPVVLEFDDPDTDDEPQRVRAVVREVQPDEGPGFRVRFEVVDEEAGWDEVSGSFDR